MNPASPSPFSAAGALAWREIVRFYRQRNRIIGSVATPVVFWLLFGLGLNRNFTQGEGAGAGFLAYFMPGSLALTVLFTAIYSSISVIEDRREGFLQGVLTAPIPSWSITLGKTLGGSAIALFQGLIFLALAFAFQRSVPLWMLPALVLFLAVGAVGMSALGLALAWRMDSSQGFHAVMNLILMPMWLLSGGFFPAPEGSSAWSERILHVAMRINPMSYFVGGVRHLAAPETLHGGWFPGSLECWIATAGFAAFALVLATLVAQTRTQGDLL